MNPLKTEWQPEWVTLVSYDGTEHQHAMVTAHNKDGSVNLWVWYETPLDDNPNTAPAGMQYLTSVPRADSMPAYPPNIPQHLRVFWKPKG